VADETCLQMNDLYEKWAEKGGAGSTPLCALSCKQFEEKYQLEAEKAVSDENCYKIYLVGLCVLCGEMFFEFHR